MKVLVTGSAGRIGRQVAPALRAAGHDVRTFDRSASREPDHVPGTTLDPMSPRRAVQGCDAVVHLAAVPNDMSGRADDIFATNVLGTYHVLQAAAEAGVERFVFFSSIQVLGLTSTDRLPDYLPLDDDHPCLPQRPYSLSKNLGEATCRYFADTAGMSVISLRPPLVTDEEMYQWWRSREPRPRSRSNWWRRNAASDVWSYCDVRDVARAVVLSLEAPDVHFEKLLLAAKDTTSQTPTAELLAGYFPDVPLRLPAGALEAEPFHGLIDTSRAKRVIGWEPLYSWRDGESGEVAQ